MLLPHAARRAGEASRSSSPRQGQILQQEHARTVDAHPPHMPRSQGRVTDHRVGLTVHGIDEVMRSGAIEPFTKALALDLQMKLLASLGA